MSIHSNDIDVPRLRAELAETAKQIKKLKAELRRTWTRPMAYEQKTLWALKDKATLLCILRAYSRGRYHCTKPMQRWVVVSQDWNQEAFHLKMSERAIERYDLGARE